jgi:hypothetical protein
MNARHHRFGNSLSHGSATLLALRPCALRPAQRSGLEWQPPEQSMIMFGRPATHGVAHRGLWR